jgi:hypothetical protein
MARLCIVQVRVDLHASDARNCLLHALAANLGEALRVRKELVNARLRAAVKVRAYDWQQQVIHLGLLPAKALPAA